MRFPFNFYLPVDISMSLTEKPKFLSLYNVSGNCPERMRR